MSDALQSPLISDDQSGEDIVQRIGHLVRLLRNSMKELGLDKEVEKAAEAIPDARDRLSYIAVMTEQAAERALNAIDRAQPLQDKIAAGAKALDARWQAWFENPMELDQAKELVIETRSFLAEAPELTDKTNKELLEIMMAQDFQDLTGQVIKRMMEVIREMEFQLLQVLLDSVSEDDERPDLQRRTDDIKQSQSRKTSSLLNGPPVTDSEPDVVADQDQVDDLLAELGF